MARFPCRALGRRRAWLDALEPRLMLSSDPLTDMFEAPGVGQPARVSVESPLLTLQQIHVTTGVDAAHVDYGLTGLGQTVVVIDSGIAYDHPALGGGFGSSYRVVGGWDFTEENDDDPYDDGPAGFHGTHVAGIIGSSDRIHRGVAPAVDLVALRIFNDRGRGKLDWLESSLQWVVEHVDAFDHPITTVNLSLGTDWNAVTLPEYATLEDELRDLYDAGVFVVVAAGNQFDATHEGLSYPAASPLVTPVASLDAAGHLSDFSQRYTTAIAAPGEKITSTVPDYLEDFNGVTDDFYAASGTSMAAPYVAASSVLVREAMQRSGVREITVDAIRNVLTETAELVFDPVTGQSYRRLNVVAAIEQILGPLTANVIDLGVIDSPVTYFTQPTMRPTELQFISRYSGLLSVEVIRSTTSSSSPGPGQLPQAQPDRWILSVVENQPVRADLPLGNAISQLRVTPLVTQRGNLLVVDGTTGNDEILFDENGRATINRHRFSFTPGSIDQVTIVGGGGEDRLRLFSRHDHSRVVLSPGQIQLTHAGLQLTGNSLERIEVFVHGAKTTTTFYDSHGPDRFFAKPTHSWMKSGQYFNYVRGSHKTTGWASDARDLAVLYDSSAADVLIVDPRQAELAGPNYENQAIGFQMLFVRAQGGQDRATMIGSPEDDFLQTTPSVASLRGPEFFQYVMGIENITVHGNGGFDTATLMDGPGSDRFIARPGSHTIETPASIRNVRDFSRVEAFASTGEDRAEFHGSPADETFTAKPTHSWFESGAELSDAKGFDAVFATSGGGNDTALLYDSGGDDLLVLEPNSSTFSGASFQYDVASFAKVHAFSQGGNDFAEFVDSPTSDQFFATSNASWMVGAGFRTIAEGFAHVVASSSEGVDVAFLLDSADDDDLSTDRDRVDWDGVNWDGAEFHYDLASFARIVTRATDGQNRLAVDSVLSQAMREFDNSAT